MIIIITQILVYATFRRRLLAITTQSDYRQSADVKFTFRFSGGSCNYYEICVQLAGDWYSCFHACGISWCTSVLFAGTHSLS